MSPELKSYALGVLFLLLRLVGKSCFRAFIRFEVIIGYSAAAVVSKQHCMMFAFALEFQIAFVKNLMQIEGYGW